MSPLAARSPLSAAAGEPEPTTSAGDGAATGRDAAGTAPREPAGSNATPHLVMRQVSVSLTRSRHAHQRRVRNEVLNNLLEFGSLMFLRKPTPGQEVDELLRQVSLEADAGQVVGVLSSRPASARTLLEVVAGMAPLDSGEIERRGRAASLGQIPAVTSQYESCRRNLGFLGRFLGASRSELATALLRVQEICRDLPVLDLPLRRVPGWAFDDLALVMICELGFETLLVPEISLPTSERVAEYWLEYLGTAPQRDQLILVSSRRSETILPHVSRLLLLDGPALCAFDSVESLEATHPALLEQALAARPEPKDVPLPLADEDDDDEEDEEDEGEERDPQLERRPEEAAAPGEARQEGEVLLGHTYANRASPYCSIVTEGPDRTRLLRPDLSEARPEADLCGLPETVSPLPAIYREEGALLRLAIETHRPNLWLLPGLDLLQRKTPLLRSFPASEIFVPEPQRLTFDVRIPPNFLQHCLYWLSAFVCITDEQRRAEDVAIAKNLLIFLNLSREGPVRPGLNPGSADYPVFFRQPGLVTQEPIPEAADYSMTSLTLLGRDGQALPRRELGHAVEEPELGFEVVATVLALRPVRQLALLADFWRSEGVEIRLESQPVALEPGSHRLRLKVPPGLLRGPSYRLRVGLAEPEVLRDPARNPTECQETLIHVAEPPKPDEPLIARWRAARTLLDGPLVWERGGNAAGPAS